MSTHTGISSLPLPAMAEAFLKWSSPTPMTRFSSPTTRAGSGAARNIKKGRDIISTFFPAYFFGTTNLKLIKKQEKFKGVWGHALPENF